MSEFFQSEIVREELEEINELQQEIYGKIMNITNLSNEDKVEHIEKLKVLLDKQRVMYTRLALSDDPEAKKLKKQLEDSVQLMGFPAGTDIQVLFDGMKQTIDNLSQRID
tara:strand:- start:183 stop:512 length:330 start_codon:yes stop_codon:yes gene_type:complete